MRDVVIAYRFLPQYRRDFYDQLRLKLAECGVNLRLFYGNGDELDREKRDLIHLEWGQYVPNRIFTFAGRKLYWQPITTMLKGADLIIVEQASRLLLNYYLQVSWRLGGPKLAYWGHGKNFQADGGHRIAEWMKKKYSASAHWWFAYNELSAEIVQDLGFPSERITVVNNAIDTQSLHAWVVDARRELLFNILTELGLTGANIGLFVGGMYREKSLEFLIQAATIVRRAIPDFELVLCGDGPDAGLAQQAATENSWIRYVGPRFEKEKAELLAVAKVVLMPGAVGLGVLDAFAAGLPVLTTSMDNHGPEFSYVTDGTNGVIAEPIVADYAQAIIDTLRSTTRLGAMGEAAISTAAYLTVENMVDRFSEGILAALS